MALANSEGGTYIPGGVRFTTGGVRFTLPNGSIGLSITPNEPGNATEKLGLAPPLYKGTALGGLLNRTHRQVECFPCIRNQGGTAFSHNRCAVNQAPNDLRNRRQIVHYVQQRFFDHVAQAPGAGLLFQSPVGGGGEARRHPAMPADSHGPTGRVLGPAGRIWAIPAHSMHYSQSLPYALFFLD